MSDLNCSEYSEKAIVVRGDSTKTYKEELKALGGKYNAILKGGPGWIFYKTSAGKVDKFISSVNKGEVKPSSHVEEKVNRRILTAHTNVDLRLPVVLEDIKTLMKGKDPDYKLKFISSVTSILLSEQPQSPKLKPTQVINSEEVVESEEEEDAPPRRRLLKA